MKRHPVTKGIQTIELEGWREFYELILTRFIEGPAYVFRGHADASWKTYSSLDRWEQEHPTTRYVIDGKSHLAEHPPVTRAIHLQRFRQAVRSIAPFDLSKQKDDPIWALAQHHGLKTPLLDWSYSPFVALYFAFEDELVREGRSLIEPNRRAVLALSTRMITEERGSEQQMPSLFPRVYSPSGPVSQRLLAQSSIFVQMPEKTDLETFVADQFADSNEGPGRHPSEVLIKILVPNTDRLECLRMLNKMNINRVTLFPDLDGAARYINDLWDIDPGSTMGFFEDTDYLAER